MKRQGAEPRCSGLGDEGRRAAIRRGEMNATTKVSMRRQMSKRVGPRVEPSPWLGREPSSIKNTQACGPRAPGPGVKNPRTGRQQRPQASHRRSGPATGSGDSLAGPRTLPHCHRSPHPENVPPSLIRQPTSHWAASWTPIPPLFTWSGVPGRHISTSRTTIYGKYAFQVTSIRVPALAPLAPVWFPQVAKPASLQDCPPHFMDD